MRCKVHILDRLSGRVLAAELTTEHDDARPVVRIDGLQLEDMGRFELLPFSAEDELGAPSFGGGKP
jgi:hypothetical protein